MVFTDHEIQDGEVYKAAALLSDALEIGTLQIELYIRDTETGAALTAFRRNDKLLYYHQDRLRGTYYVDSIERTGQCTYKIRANDALALLDQSNHMGGIYTGQTVGELIAEICNIPCQVQSKFSKIKLYGWLPVATRRANLAQVLFAIGAHAKVDENGVLRIEALWTGISSTVTLDRVFWGDKVRYASKVTEVSVIEHQYIPGTEEIQLFEGTTQEGDMIQFQEPVYDLSASGFSILEQGANYAKVSAGAGTLSGKRYIHTTRDIRRSVTPGDIPNVVEVKEATLVSLVNSAAVAERLAGYYSFCETMEADVVYQAEVPGDVITFEHPFGGECIGCIKSTSITLGGKLVAMETTAIGYRPPVFEDTEILEERVLLTGSGEWNPPSGVEKVHAVIIQAGGAGYEGSAGGSVDLGSVGHQRRDGKFPADPGSTSVTASAQSSSPSAGKGGEGGKAGEPGKVFEVDIPVADGTPVQYACGIGGATVGQAGGETTFGGRSSSEGAILQNGYMDIITGVAYAVRGVDGAKGGDGGGSGEDGKPSGATNGGKAGIGGTVSDRESASDGPYKTFYANLDGSIGDAGGGGAGGFSGKNQGSPGKDAAVSYRGAYILTLSSYGRQASGRAYGLEGGAGGDGAPGETGETFGSSGSGGGGGGGAGKSSASISINVTNKATVTVNDGGGGGQFSAVATVATEAVSGGKGGSFGKGADGCVILYYGVPKKRVSGPMQDKNKCKLLDKNGRRIVV